MIEKDGWRIHTPDHGATIALDNRPLVEAAKAKGLPDPEMRHVVVPRSVIDAAAGIRRGEPINSPTRCSCPHDCPVHDPPA